ncbi:MAG: NUDIX domain-containing protein [Gemmatimonadota bacterium]|nr:NUDIX domain-containing protein [Gemmatimonadota bacterium]
MAEAEEPLRETTEVSAGGVIYRADEDAPMVALTRSRRGPVWVLPKGRIEEGETTEEAALREVREETGLLGRIVRPLSVIRYTYKSRDDDDRRGMTIHKTVHFFLLEFVEGRTEDHDHEVLEVKWFPLGLGGRILFHAGEREVLAAARTILDPPP